MLKVERRTTTADWGQQGRHDAAVACQTKKRTAVAETTVGPNRMMIGCDVWGSLDLRFYTNVLPDMASGDVRGTTAGEALTDSALKMSLGPTRGAIQPQPGRLTLPSIFIAMLGHILKQPIKRYEATSTLLSRAGKGQRASVICRARHRLEAGAKRALFSFHRSN
jgi:hypothetical protein